MKKLFSILLIATFLTGCTSATASFDTLSSHEAYQLINEDETVIVIDVRSKEEFATGHINGAILLPVDQIEAHAEEILQNKDAVILVICRSGARSQYASQLLADLGYTNIYDIGGILSWPGELVTE